MTDWTPGIIWANDIMAEQTLGVWEQDPDKVMVAITASERETRRNYAAVARAKARGMTRADYERTSSALPRDLQDEIVRRHRRGEALRKIVAEMPDARVGEYSVKRVLIAYKNDPKAFMRTASSDIAIWR